MRVLLNALFVAGLAGTALAGTAAFGGALAQTQAAPETAPIACKDGSTWPTTVRRGACRGHGGIAEPGAAPAAAGATAAPAAETSAAGTPITCKDGSTWPTTVRRGACRGHGGVAAAGAAPAAAATPAAAAAAAPETPAAGAPITCKDGSTWPTTVRRGACRGHGGIAAAGAAPAATAPAAAATTAPATAAPAPTPASTPATTPAAPAGGTAAAQPADAILCKDGSTWPTTVRRGACRGHGGIQQATPAVAAAPAPAAPAPTPGGGANQVWVNADTKVFHCSDDIWFGRTKKGAYMTEAAARAAGNRPSRGKDCPDVPVPGPAQATPPRT